MTTAINPQDLGTETVTKDHEVSETLRKEQIDDPDTNIGGPAGTGISGE